MQRALQSAVGAALHSSVVEVRSVAGGDINDAFRVSLADGRLVFVKTNRTAPAAMFASEARGLHWLAEANALAIPRVLAVSDRANEAFLVLEFLEAAEPVSQFDDHLGQGLARLHSFGAPCFGFDHDNFIGRLPQHNWARPDWPSFYRDCRLLPQIERAASHGLLDTRLQQRLGSLCERIEEWTGAVEPPARLHGDLWAGNLHIGPTGEPCLIDPAVYGGHREMDLAMMKLFGGFNPRVFEAYNEAFPLSPGFSERVELYQLYPLLVHVNLFGGSYLASVERALRRYS